MNNRLEKKNRSWDEPSTGVRVKRRIILKGSAAAALSLALGRFALAESRSSEAANMSADAFFDGWRDLAKRLIDDEAIGEEQYIRELDNLISQLPLNVIPPRKKVVFEGDGLKTGPAWFEGRIFVVELTLEPHAVIQPHNHPSHNAVSFGLAGTCQYEHYEIIGDAPPSIPGTPPFTVQRTRSGLLFPGRLSEFTRTRDNIHTFRAGKDGATILDFTSTVGNPKTEFSALQIDTEPRGTFGRLYQARWLGNPYR